MTAYSAADWGGFGTTAATAAATLTGLLFIAVSINLRQILDHGPLPGRAAQTLIFFAFPMMAALLLVVPAQAQAALGGELIATGIFAWATAMVIDGDRYPGRPGQHLGAAGRDPALTRPARTQLMPSFSAAIRVPATRLVIFWKATSRA